MSVSGKTILNIISPSLVIAFFRRIFLGAVILVVFEGKIPNISVQSKPGKGTRLDEVG